MYLMSLCVLESAFQFKDYKTQEIRTSVNCDFFFFFKFPFFLLFFFSRGSIITMSFSKDYNSCSVFTDWYSKQLNKPIWQLKVRIEERDSYNFLHV